MEHFLFKSSFVFIEKMRASGLLRDPFKVEPTVSCGGIVKTQQMPEIKDLNMREATHKDCLNRNC